MDGVAGGDVAGGDVAGGDVAGGRVSSGGSRNSQPGTLNHLFFRAVEQYNKPDALQVKRGGRYEPISHATLAQRVRHVALGLEESGVAASDRVAILSENRPEWAIADYACLTLGVADVPIYPNLPAEQIAYQLVDSAAVAVFVSTAEQAVKIASIRSQCPALRLVIVFDGGGDASRTIPLSELEALGAKADSSERTRAYRAKADAVRPDDLATIIYTSGTTGPPKGVMLTHDNLFANVEAGRAAVPFEGADTMLSFLPLSHVLERMAGHFLAMATGTSIAYAESMDAVPQNLAEVRPTLVISVPRLYEKMYARVVEAATAGGGMKRRIFVWARAVSERWADVRLAGGVPRGVLAAQYAVAQRLVFSKLQARTGGRLRYFVSGGAPLASDINKFFYAAGLVILEGYGLTETSPLLSVNTPGHFRLGTVGRPVSGVELRIAEDGEILARGPNIMRGYYHNDQATAAAIDTDGWFHTGDIGELRDGFLAITDRKKDIIVTAGGKNIAPQPIENMVRSSKFVTDVVMIGDRRKYPVLLVVPDWKALESWAHQANVTWTSRAAALTLRAVREKMDGEVRATLTGLAHFESPKKIGLLEHEFSQERGELTATLKVRRRVIDKAYKDVIDALYA